MEPRGGGGPAGQDEAAQGLEGRVEAVDRLLERLDVRLGDAQRLPGLHRPAALRPLRDAEIGPQIEQIVLDALEERRPLDVRDDKEREAEDGVQLVDRAVRLDARRVLRDAPPVAERGRSLVPGLRVDPREQHHRDEPPAASY